jgi:hypothetical protein
LKYSKTATSFLCGGEVLPGAEARMERAAWISWAAGVVVAMSRGEQPLTDALFAELTGFFKTLTPFETEQLGAQITLLQMQ